MENINYANLKETSSNQPLVAVDWQKLNQLLGKNFLSPHQANYQITTLDSGADILIEICKNSFKLVSNLDNTKIFSSSLNRFEFYFDKIIKLHNQYVEHESSKNKNLLSFNKNNSHWPKAHELFLKLNLFLRDSRNIIEFTQRFFQLDQMGKFKTIHLFIHKKGAVSSKHIELKADSFNEGSQGVKEFTTLFQAIKKSKNRSFGQSTLKAANFQILGTCIAHEFSLLNHNLILIFSKDDFLPQEERDIVFFNEYKECFKSYFELLLNAEFNYEKSLSIHGSLKNLPYFANLLDNDFEVIGITTNYRKLLHLDYEDILKLLKEKHFNLADINHQERIILLGELLNTLKHELSNPLFGLQLSSELLLQEELDEEQNEFIRHIHSNISRSQTIINNFAGLYKDNPVIEDVDLEVLINEVFTLTKSESKQVQKKIIFKDPKVTHISTNPTYLAQILFNLIINGSQALKESQTLSPKIDVTIGQKNNSVQITVKDNGPGINSEKMKEIFEPFYTTKHSGTGLGLAISKRLSEKINAQLIVQPCDDGACFIIEVNQ